MGKTNNYWYPLQDVEATQHGKEAREEALKEHTTAKKSKAKKGKKPAQSVAVCPYAKPAEDENNTPSKPATVQAIPCKYTTIKINKEGGDHVLTARKNKTNAIQVVAGSFKKPATIECILNGLSGPCEKHTNKTYTFGETSLEKTSSNLKFKVYSSRTVLNFPWKCSPITYNLNANTCDNKVRARVEVFPDTELSISLSINFNTEKESSSSTETSVKGIETSRVSYSKASVKHEEKSSSKTTGACKIKGTFKHDGHEFSIEENFKQLISQVNRVYELKANFTRLMTTLGENPVSKVIVYQGHNVQTKKSKTNIKWPSLETKLSGKWNEEGAVCKYKGELSLGFAPLIGVEVEIDLVETFFKATPMGVIKKVLEWANLEAFNLLLKMGGEIEGSVGVEIEYDNGIKYTPKGSIEGKIPVSVEAILLKSKGTYLWILDVDAEASIAAESGVSIKAEGNSMSEVNVEGEFSGLQVFLVAKASFGISSSNSKPPPGLEEEPAKEEDDDEEDDDKPSENKLLLFEIGSKTLYEDKFDLS